MVMKNSVWLIEDWSEFMCESPEYYGVCYTREDADKELVRLNGIAYRKQLNKWREEEDRGFDNGWFHGNTIHPSESFTPAYYAKEVPVIFVGGK